MPRGQTTCEYCGSICDRVVPRAVAARSVSGDVFNEIRRSAAWANRDSSRRQVSLPQMPPLAAVAPFLFFAVFIAVSGFIALMALAMSGVFGFAGMRMGGPLGGGIALVPALMALVPAGFVALGVVMFRKHRRTLNDFRNAPIESHPALIAAKRTQVSGGGENSSASTSYFLTAQFEDGSRKEFALMTPDLYSRLSEGDAGVLFVRGRFALDFDRVV
ncbi:MAG: DUF2500 domain-containing protein [Planctomycetaceae bacterium]|nr:DUF2500 domain-containing protein [Planctomycetaceae bacterium]